MGALCYDIFEGRDGKIKDRPPAGAIISVGATVLAVVAVLATMD
jgi:hypothetical protein